MTARRATAFAALWLTAVAGLAAGLWSGPAAAAGADWPREVRSGEATIVLYQPQFDSLEGIDTRARIAVAIQRPDLPPEFGALWVAATLDVDRDEDTARFQTFVIERARFPDATEQEVKDLTALIERTAPTWDLNLSLAELRAGLEAEGGAADPGFRNDPPRIVYRDRPAILVTLDGEPKLQAIKDTGYQRVVNTPFPIVFDPSTRQYWLFGSEIWFTTRDLIRGPWSPRDGAPAGIARLFSPSDGQNTGEPPLDPGEGVPKEQLRKAEIIVSTVPAELISTEGAPQYRPLVGDDMLYVTNTGSDLFLEVPTKRYYVVLSGRWYRSSALTGPWAYVDPAKVPRAFADVPKKSEKAEVLAHVPGTDEAKDAVMDAMIPQTSAVRRGDADLEVTWDGTPQFERIPGTSLLYARNTPSQVLKVDGRYYAVEQGVWYVSDSPYGPWEVADSRPGEVEKIPPSSPAYNVKYVYIYDYTPEVVYVGYLPGYTWAFPYRGAVVYGTGYYYRPWWGPAYYYPRPSTWGFHMHYDPWYGWGYGMSWSAGWLSFSWGWGGGWGGWGYGYPYGYRQGYWNGYNSGFWAGQHTGGWFGPGGYRPPPPHYSDRGPRRGFRPPDRSQIGSLPGIGGRPSARPRPVNNIYARPGSRPDSRTSLRPDRRQDFRGDARPRPDTDPRSGTGAGAGQRSGERRTIQPVPRPTTRLPNDVYVDREGIPYRRTKEGWQTRENRRWRPAPELERQRGTPPVARDTGRPDRRNDGRPDTRADARPDTRQDTRPDSRREGRPPTRDVERPATGMPPPVTETQRPEPRRSTSPGYRPSPPVELRRRVPEPPSRSSSREYRPEPGGRPPPSGGWGNRSGPRDGPSVPAANQSRMRSSGADREKRR
ncbi:MAG: hypothetical protein OEW88_00545 [Gammaproteobacteria bacterium]|nr:hypothetical protein [Gammaproteobacteria bacterium]